VDDSRPQPATSYLRSTLAEPATRQLRRNAHDDDARTPTLQTRLKTLAALAAKVESGERRKRREQKAAKVKSCESKKQRK
jgi:hypothetical protein